MCGGLSKIFNKKATIWFVANPAMGAQLRQPCDKNSLCCHLNNSVTVYFHPTNMQSKPKQAQICGISDSSPTHQLSNTPYMCGYGLTYFTGLVYISFVDLEWLEHSSYIHSNDYQQPLLWTPMGFEPKPSISTMDVLPLHQKHFFRNCHLSATKCNITSNAFPRGLS